MGFWDGYSQPRASRRFQVTPRPSPSLPGAAQFSIARPEETAEILEFLETFFGDVPRTPIFRPFIHLSDREEVLIDRRNGSIRATIRYKYSGTFEGQPIYLIDCFCIHPDVRRTGIGSRILSALHDRTGSKAMLFLKEGRPVPGIQPLYSSSYVYRHVEPARCMHVAPVSPHMASHIVQTYRSMHPDTFWLHSTTNPNQSWRLWKQGLTWGLACFQDAFQTHPVEKGRIGWMTALFCSVGLSQLALEDLVNAAPFDWIWTDRVWMGSCDGWSVDGPFHWYTYRWTTSCLPSTCLPSTCLPSTTSLTTSYRRPCYGIIV
jgi:GNAT superfamily N-acetyltransferase